MRKAIERCKSRRFTTYWAVRAGSTSPAAKKLMALRAAQQVEIVGADEFFPQLAEKIEALASLNHLHPLSVQVAIAQTKKYVADPKCRIQLHDLLMDEVEHIINIAWSSDNPLQGSSDDISVCKRISELESLSGTACAIAAAGGRWGRPEHHDLWVAALTRLGNPDRPQGCNERLQGLRSYPALLVYYAAGIGAIHGGRIDTVNVIFQQPKIRSSSNPETYPLELFNALSPDVFKVFEDLKNTHFPRSLRLHQALRDPLRTIIPGDGDYTRVFDTFETLQSLHCADSSAEWAMPGPFMYRYYDILGGRRILQRDGSPLLEMDDEVSRLGSSAAILGSGFLDGSKERWTKAVQLVHKMTEKCG